MNMLIFCKSIFVPSYSSRREEPYALLEIRREQTVFYSIPFSLVLSLRQTNAFTRRASAARDPI